MGNKQSIKKGVAIGMVSLLMIHPIFAQSSADDTSRLLTLNSVIEKAIGKEEKVSVLHKQIEAYKEKLQSVQNIGGMAYQTTRYAYEQILLDEETLKDKVAYQVTQLYETILLLQKQIQLNEKEIEIAQKELQAAQIKKNKGQLSIYDLSQAQLAIENKKAEKQKNEWALLDNQTQFFNLTGLHLEDDAIWEEDLSYEVLGEEEALQHIITKNVDYYMENTEAYAAYQEEHMVDVLEYKYGSTGVTMEMWTNNKADLAQNSYQVSQQRKQLIQSLQTTSVELKKLEETIALQEKNIAQMQEQLKKISIYYSKGHVSELEKLKAEQSVRQLELSKIQSIYTYQQLKMAFEKPWVRY